MAAPLTPADCDLRSFAFMPVDIVRLFSSSFHLRANDSEWRAGVTLWLKSFHQVPAASLPDDDGELAMLAELGRDLKTWRRLRDMALHGWVKCDDGRLYHPVVAEKANEAWGRSRSQKAKAAKRWDSRGTASAPGPGNTNGNASADAAASPTAHAAALPQDMPGECNRHWTWRETVGNIPVVPSLPKAPPVASPKRGARLPDDWVLPESWAEHARQHHPDLDIGREAQRFADHWHAKSGAGGTKHDWFATWRNWLKTAEDRLPVSQRIAHGFGNRPLPRDTRQLTDDERRRRLAAAVESIERRSSSEPFDA